jgi:glycosyltransferase involved in cell wall biosynthesis
MCNSFNYLRGGAERYFIDLSELLTANGHEVIPFCMHDERNLPSKYSDYFISAIDFPSKLGKGKGIRSKLDVAERVIFSREAKRNIERLIADTKPDIAHIHGIAHETSPSILPAIKKAGIPITQTLHDYKLICPDTSLVSQGKVCERCKGHHYYNVVRYRCKRDSLSASLLTGVEMAVHKIFKIYERNVDLFMTPSRFMMDKVREFGIQNEIINIPYFVDFENFQPFFEPDDYFLFYGRLVDIKGIETLLKAMEGVNRSHLYIAGRGDLEETLKTFAHSHGIENVTFLGHLDKDELIPLIQKAMFSIVPSEWYENYPMAVLEAFACGTAVIGADIGGIPEQVKDGHNGLLFESGNAAQLHEKIQCLVNNKELAVQMGRNGRQQMMTINDPESHYHQIISIYQNLIRQVGKR